MWMRNGCFAWVESDLCISSRSISIAVSAICPNQVLRVQEMEAVAGFTDRMDHGRQFDLEKLNSLSFI